MGFRGGVWWCGGGGVGAVVVVVVVGGGGLKQQSSVGLSTGFSGSQLFEPQRRSPTQSELESQSPSPSPRILANGPAAASMVRSTTMVPAMVVGS